MHRFTVGSSLTIPWRSSLSRSFDHTMSHLPDRISPSTDRSSRPMDTTCLLSRPFDRSTAASSPADVASPSDSTLLTVKHRSHRRFMSKQLCPDARNAQSLSVPTPVASARIPLLCTTFANPCASFACPATCSRSRPAAKRRLPALPQHNRPLRQALDDTSRRLIHRRFFCASQIYKRRHCRHSARLLGRMLRHKRSREAGIRYKQPPHRPYAVSPWCAISMDSTAIVLLSARSSGPVHFTG